MPPRLLLLAPLMLAACMGEPDPPSGAADFATYCTACHGTGGKGDGPLAEGLDPKPADLTQLSARNGGAFPGTAVMAQIWGYADGRDSARVMPQFAAALEGDLVLYDGGDGIASPTPIRLVQIAEYLRALQE